MARHADQHVRQPLCYDECDALVQYELLAPTQLQLQQIYPSKVSLCCLSQAVLAYGQGG